MQNNSENNTQKSILLKTKIIDFFDFLFEGLKLYRKLFKTKWTYICIVEKCPESKYLCSHYRWVREGWIKRRIGTRMYWIPAELDRVGELIKQGHTCKDAIGLAKFSRDERDHPYETESPF